VLLPPVLIMGHALTRPRQPADIIPTHPATRTVEGLKSGPGYLVSHRHGLMPSSIKEEEAV
jgi:hypothetical protein